MATKTNRISKADRKPLTQARLRELLHYDPDTGAFTRIGASRPQTAHWASKPLGFIKRDSLSAGGGYHMICVDGRAYRAHRLAWLYVTGTWPQADVDHINRDRADNRWPNLRAANRSQNLQNAGRRRDNTSGIKGVSYDASRSRWIAQVSDNGRHVFIGRFDDKERAAAAYKQYVETRFGDFARVA